MFPTDAQVARVMHMGNKNYPHITYADVFLTKCRYRTDPIAKTWHCRASTQECSYCPSTYVIHDEVMKELVRCKMNEIVEVWCPPRKWAEKNMENIYGLDWHKELGGKNYVYKNEAASH